MTADEDGHPEVVEANVSWLHEIVAMDSQEEKIRKLSEAAASLTDGNKIFSSGTNIVAILKACK